MKFKSDKQRKAVMANMQNGNTTKASSCVPSPTPLKNLYPTQKATEPYRFRYVNTIFPNSYYITANSETSVRVAFRSEAKMKEALIKAKQQQLIGKFENGGRLASDGTYGFSILHEKIDARMKKTPKSKLTIIPTSVPRGSGNNPNAGLRDTKYKIKEWGFIFNSKKEAEKYANTHIERNGEIITR